MKFKVLKNYTDFLSNKLNEGNEAEYTLLQIASNFAYLQQMIISGYLENSKDLPFEEDDTNWYYLKEDSNEKKVKEINPVGYKQSLTLAFNRLIDKKLADFKSGKKDPELEEVENFKKKIKEDKEKLFNKDKKTIGNLN